MVADEQREGIPEDVGIELARDVPSESCFERRQDGIGAKVEIIDFPDGGKAAVEVWGGFLASHDADAWRELAVDGGHPVERVHRELRRGVEVRDLCQCVDAGVGAAGSVEAQRLFGNFLQGLLDDVLDGISTHLGLPAAVGASVVGDGEFKAHVA